MGECVGEALGGLLFCVALGCDKEAEEEIYG